MKVLKQRVARRLLPRKRVRAQAEFCSEPEPPRHFWQKRFYDFNVWSRRKKAEKLRYMHRNPVKRGLVSSPELWPWSSFRSSAYGEKGRVEVNAPMRKRQSSPTQRKPRRVGHSQGLRWCQLYCSPGGSMCGPPARRRKRPEAARKVRAWCVGFKATEEEHTNNVGNKSRQET
jgi:hypothetical protein